jgi:chromate transporter
LTSASDGVVAASATDDTTGKPARVGLVQVIKAFGYIGLTSFGGARAAYFRHVLVVSHRWINDQQFLEGLTVAQTLPGPNVSNFSVYFGNRLRGPLGAAAALLSFLVPGAIMIVILAAFAFGHENFAPLRSLFLGVGAAAVGLSIATTWQIGIRGLHARWDWITVAVTFAAVAFLHLSLLVPLFVIAPVSVFLWRPRTPAKPLAAEESETAGAAG